MKENNDINPETSAEKKKTSWWTWLALIIIFGVGGYFGFQQLGILSTNKIFTEYPPISNDTLLDTSPQDSILENNVLGDSTQVALEDSTEIAFSQDTVVENTPQYETPQPVETSTVDLFKVNTSYGKIDSATAKAAAKVEVGTNEDSKFKTNSTGLFEELLMPENVDANFEKAFAEYSQIPIVSSKSILKLLSIIGKQILVGKNTDDVQDIIQILMESDNVVGILIVDRKGKIIYTTNQKQINAAIQNIMPKVDIKSNNLSWYQEVDKTVAAVPLFHTYGKIGVAVLVTGR